MKFAKHSIYTALLLLAHIGAANAIPAFWTDEFDPDDIRLSAGSALPATSVDFTLDIRGGATGFRPGLDLIESAVLTVLLYDDFDLFRETVSFSFDGGAFTPSQNVDGLSFLPDLFVFDPIDFISDGLLNVVATATRGDFLFDSAFLVAFGERVEVPEPTGVALFAVALLAMGIVLRRRQIRVRS